jgi:hypothetical protein
MPTRLLSEQRNNSNIEYHQLTLNNYSYAIVEVKKGTLFTDRFTNISLIINKKLIPLVSWQYENDEVVSDNENYVLQKKILINQLPVNFKCTVVSILTGGGGNYNYYHWLYDCLPRLSLAQNYISPKENVMYFIPEDTIPFQKESLDALGIFPNKRISSLQHHFISANKIIATSHPNPNPSVIPAWIIQYLRTTFLPKASNKYNSEKIYLSRGDSINSRRLLNESELIDKLIKKGFHVYQLSQLHFFDQICLFNNASVIVGVHGASFANLAFAKTTALVYELFSDVYQPDMYESVAKQLNMSYVKIIGTSSGNSSDPQKTNFTISEQLIDTICESIPKH